MKMTRGEKRRRKLAKVVEMKLDGIPVAGWQRVSYEELCQYHSLELKRRSNPHIDYYGQSLIDQVTFLKAQELQNAMDRQLLEEINVRVSKTN